MIELRAFEPPGTVLRLSPEDCLRHCLVTGSTGAGKTSAVVNPVLNQLIGWCAGDRDKKVGLLVLDPKADDTPDKVLAYARAHGREKDVVVLSDDGNAWYDLLGGFHRLDQLEQYTERLLSGTREMGLENAYWTEGRNGLIETALILLLANGSPIRFEDAIAWMQAWWFGRESQPIEDKLQFVRKVIDRGTLDEFTRQRLELALREVRNFATLDARTREIFKSTLSNAMRPLVSPSARRLFDSSKPIRFDVADLLRGKVLIVSLDALRNPALARLIFRVVRRDFYEIIQSRKAAFAGRDRLCGLVCDELALSVMEQDIDALAVIRSKGAFAICCVQSWSAIQGVLGRRGTEALLANFGSFFFFGSREAALDEFAYYTMGLTKPKPRRRESTSGDLLDVTEIPIRRWICPPGKLATLQQHHALAKLTNGFVTETPVWLEPHFFESPVKPVIKQEDSLSKAVAQMRSSRPPTAGSEVAPFLLHMNRRGHRIHLSQATLMAAWQACAPALSQNQILKMGLYLNIGGLESLPRCWALGLVSWCSSRPRVASVILSVSVRSGMLWPELDGPTVWWGDAATALPEILNTLIYPSLFRPLKKRHIRQLVVERPDLREELSSPRQDAQVDKAF